MPVPTDRAFGAYTTKKGETLRSLRLSRCEFGGWKRGLMCSARRVVPTIVPEALEETRGVFLIATETIQRLGEDASNRRFKTPSTVAKCGERTTSPVRSAGATSRWAATWTNRSRSVRRG